MLSTKGILNKHPYIASSQNYSDGTLYGKEDACIDSPTRLE